MEKSVFTRIATTLCNLGHIIILSLFHIQSFEVCYVLSSRVFKQPEALEEVNKVVRAGLGLLPTPVEMSTTDDAIYYL